jgi:hypothetical protein
MYDHGLDDLFLPPDRNDTHVSPDGVGRCVLKVIALASAEGSLEAFLEALAVLGRQQLDGIAADGPVRRKARQGTVHREYAPFVAYDLDDVRGLVEQGSELFFISTSPKKRSTNNFRILAAQPARAFA